MRRSRWLGLVAVAVLARPAAAQDGGAGDEPTDGYSPAEGGAGWTVGGYIDVGFARAQGDGTSFHPQDTRLPADYGVDTFAPAVNSRGDVASTDAGGRLTNGFLPRSLEIGGRPSLFISTASADARYEASDAPVLVFARVHLLPRFAPDGSETRLLLEQAFGRVTPFSSAELTISVGKFDSVFGIEYLENQAPLRTGITPSLVARYTTGTPLGGKLFYRVQLPAAWSALSLAAAATTSAPFVESLQPAEISLTGRPVFSGRLGYELNLPGGQLKLGASGLTGARNDQGNPDVGQRAFGGDARLYVAGLSVAAEYVRVDQDPGTAADKRTGAGPAGVPSGFHARGLYALLSYQLPLSGELLRRTTIYARAERRRAWFEGHLPIEVQRLTAGLRLDLWEAVVLKAEYLLNREAKGAPRVDNDVLAASLIFLF